MKIRASGPENELESLVSMLSCTTNEYIPVKHPACDKFEPHYFAIYEVATEENYRKIKEGEKND